MGPPAVLVENVAEALKPLQEELGKMVAAVADIWEETTRELTESIHELGGRIESLKIVAKKIDTGAGDGDDEGPGGVHADVQQRRKKRRRGSKVTTANAPTKSQRSTMFSIVRKSLDIFQLVKLRVSFAFSINIGFRTRCIVDFNLHR
ncbi:hypothetical protein RSOL_216210, partial [Rhizoctonia solani AG-3 Rhs1AP]